MHKAPPEPQSLNPAPAVWPSSGNTAALSTQPELAAFSGREAVRGKTRARFERHNCLASVFTARPNSGEDLCGPHLLPPPHRLTVCKGRTMVGTGRGREGGRCCHLEWTRPSSQHGELLRDDWYGLRATLLFYGRALERCRPHTHLYKHGCQSNALRIHTSLSFISWKNTLIFNQTRT